MEEEIRGGGAGWEPVESAAVHKKNVEPAVVVVIEEGYATTHLLEEILFVMYAPVDIERSAQAGLGGDVNQRKPQAGVPIRGPGG